MDAVRFNTREINQQWNSHRETLLSDAEDYDMNGDDDDQRSISSESSGDGGGIALSFPSKLSSQPFQGHQNTDEIAKIVEELPSSEQVLAILNSGDYSALDDDESLVNTAVLLAVLIGRHDLVLRFIHEYKADANAIDQMGRTALHLACLSANPNVSQVLIVNGADVNRWDLSHNSTPMHFAARSKSVECIQLLLRRGANVNAGIEKRSALHVAVESRAIKCVEVMLRCGANPNTPQVYTETPLHTAAALGDIDILRILLKHGADVRSQYGRCKQTALHIAAENDYADCVRALLDAGAKVDARNFNQQTALHLACLSQSAGTVELLLKSGADVNAIYKDGRTALHASIVKEAKCYECVKLLLDARIDVNRADNYGYTPLHIAALNEFSSCTNMLIEYGADITARTNGGITALSFIVRRTPVVIPKFLSKLDESITVNDHEIGDVECEVKLNFRLLVPNADRGETELLLAFIELGKKRILKHPLCETFLFLKWRRIRKFFLFSLFYHMVYVTFFTVYVMGVFQNECDDSVNQSDSKPCLKPAFVQPVGYGSIVMNCVMLAKEIFEMAHDYYKYVRYWENWVQCAIIIGVFICVTPEAMRSGDLKLVPVWQHHVAAIAIFLVWLEIMMIIGQFPMFGLYVQMFTKVAANFAKFITAYCGLLIAFALSFGVLFPNYKPFRSFFWSILKTVVMMSGELEFEDIFFNGPKTLYPGTAHIVFIAFVFLVPLILTNLLVGLAVSDIQGLQSSAGLDRLCRQAELVARLESIFFSKILQKAPRKLITLCQRSALLRTSRSSLQFEIRPNDPRDTRLPKEIVVGIYKLVAERRDRNQTVRRMQREPNTSYLRSTMDESLGEVQLRKCSNILPRYVGPSKSVKRGISTVVNGQQLESYIDTIKVQLHGLGVKLIDLKNLVTFNFERLENDKTAPRKENQKRKRMSV